MCVCGGEVGWKGGGAFVCLFVCLFVVRLVAT